MFTKHCKNSKIGARRKMNVFLGLPAFANPPPSKKKIGILPCWGFTWFNSDIKKVPEIFHYVGNGNPSHAGYAVDGSLHENGVFTPSGKINTIRSNNPKPITINHSNQLKHCTKLTLSILITVFLYKPLLYISGGLYNKILMEFRIFNYSLVARSDLAPDR